MRKNRRGVLVLSILLALLLTACGRNMVEQPVYRSYDVNPYLPQGTNAHQPPEGTVSRERGAIDPAFFTGQGEGGMLSELPIELTTGVLQRGMERYNIYCAPCHNYNGDGRGVVVQRGFPQPASLHEPRLRDADVGYFFNAMTNGFGRMYPYDRVPAEDRWAIAGYIRALQLSQYGTPEDVPAEVQLESLIQAEADR